MRVTRIVTSYHFPRPPKLTEAQFLASKNSLPFQPYINVSSEFFKEYNIVGLIFSIILFPFTIMSGYFSSASNYWSMLSEKKTFYTQLYSAINTSNTYSEYLKKYDLLVPSHYRNRSY
jgi:hypothetical protein